MKYSKESKTKLAIFDIDGTLFRSSLIVRLVGELIKQGIYPQRVKKEIEKEYLAWLNRQGSYDNYIGKVVEVYVKYIKGKKFADFKKASRVLVFHQKDRVYRFTRDLIARLKHKKYHLIAISGSPAFIVDEYAKAAGFSANFGTELEVLEGRFTGKVLNLDAAYKKDKILLEYLKQKNIRADFKHSIAVGDSETDVSILKMVGRPIAFNPNLLLLKKAKANGWEVVVERKDVIYKLNEI